MIRKRSSGPLLCLTTLLMASCKPTETTQPSEDPYMIRMDFLERKLNEMRDAADRRLQDERTRRENQIAVLEKSVQDLERRVAQSQTAMDDLKRRLAELETRTSASLLPAPQMPPLFPTPPPPPPTDTTGAPPPGAHMFPLEILNLTALSIPVRTQTSVRVLETGKMIRDEGGRRVPEVKTETYPIMEYEYRLRFTVSNRTARSITCNAEAGYGPVTFTLAPGECVTNKEIRWKGGASLLIRSENQYRVFPTPPPPATPP